MFGAVSTQDLADNVTDATPAEFPVAGTFIFISLLDTQVLKRMLRR